MRRYNSLLIDLDDTLLDFSGDEKRAILATLEKYGLPHSNDVLELYSEINTWHTFELGEQITAKTVITNHFAKLLKMLEVKEHTAEIIDDYYKLMINSHKVKNGAVKTLRQLKEKGYHLYLTTNGFPDFQYKRIKAARIYNFFDGIFISEEIDLRKPSRGFFDYVLKRIPESNRSKVLVIGDAPTADVFGGINSKLDTCWLNERDRQCKYRPTYSIKSLSELNDIL